ncbi:hypothetical protein T310_7484 [Rasamsonia emersonii CBS 393.64]|uniref:Uncharacterized protein n=1 Tax=Rasamsonia emersonii (strain ATCC 16479 / CBS 393.64 / IMI 116815) TaxID=1408163 RepID=A0A0F4YK06_RASE3|nr:hypothetical protein T310_7484 [Rasamsonia emersonii CBS 393.64]KKA18564.1 hypothetical protein T310_7484 [Rasamsonia emersonii CBS 393.64]
MSLLLLMTGAGYQKPERGKSTPYYHVICCMKLSLRVPTPCPVLLLSHSRPLACFNEVFHHHIVLELHSNVVQRADGKFSGYAVPSGLNQISYAWIHLSQIKSPGHMFFLADINPARSRNRCAGVAIFDAGVHSLAVLVPIPIWVRPRGRCVQRGPVETVDLTQWNSEGDRNDARPASLVSKCRLDPTRLGRPTDSSLDEAPQPQPGDVFVAGGASDDGDADDGKHHDEHGQREQAHQGCFLAPGDFDVPEEAHGDRGDWGCVSCQPMPSQRGHAYILKMSLATSNTVAVTKVWNWKSTAGCLLQFSGGAGQHLSALDHQAGDGEGQDAPHPDANKHGSDLGAHEAGVRLQRLRGGRQRADGELERRVHGVQLRQPDDGLGEQDEPRSRGEEVVDKEATEGVDADEEAESEEETSVMEVGFGGALYLNRGISIYGAGQPRTWNTGRNALRRCALLMSWKIQHPARNAQQQQQQQQQSKWQCNQRRGRGKRAGWIRSITSLLAANAICILHVGVGGWLAMRAHGDIDRQGLWGQMQASVPLSQRRQKA